MAYRVKGEHYQMIPDSVLFDKELTGDTVKVYCFLANHFRGRKHPIELGQRFIASSLGLSVVTVTKAIRFLESRGHILVDHEGNSRSKFMLCSNIFHGSEEEE